MVEKRKRGAEERWREGCKCLYVCKNIDSALPWGTFPFISFKLYTRDQSTTVINEGDCNSGFLRRRNLGIH